MAIPNCHATQKTSYLCYNAGRIEQLPESKSLERDEHSPTATGSTSRNWYFRIWYKKVLKAITFIDKNVIFSSNSMQFGIVHLSTKNVISFFFLFFFSLSTLFHGSSRDGRLFSSTFFLSRIVCQSIYLSYVDTIFSPENLKGRKKKITCR